MTLDWLPVPMFLCSRGAFVINYFLKCLAQSARVVSLLKRGVWVWFFFFFCAVFVLEQGGLGWLGVWGEGGEPGPLEGLLVFQRDGGNGLHLWRTFVIDSL